MHFDNENVGKDPSGANEPELIYSRHAAGEIESDEEDDRGGEELYISSISGENSPRPGQHTQPS